MRKLLPVVFLLNAPLLSSPALLAAPPVLSAVVDSATLRGTTLAPGGLATIFGSSLALETAYAPGYPLPAYLGSANVYVNGREAPLLYVSPGQINFLVPWDARTGQASVVMIVNNTVSNQLYVSMAPAAPAVFGSVLVSAYRQPATLEGKPAHAGEYITIFATGLGAGLDVPQKVGASPPDDGSVVNLTMRPGVTVGGFPSTVSYAGLAPPGMNGAYTAGVYQITALVPPGISPGNSVPVQVSMNGVSSNAVNIALAAGAAPSIAKFLTLGPSGTIARLITSENNCPSITIDGVARAMDVRAGATLPFYPVTSCETAIPAPAQIVTLDGQQMLLPVQNPQRITVLGDTGCRMDNANSQACNVPASWPVSAINASAAATKPQLMVHDGDYHYREYPCMNSGCVNSPWGYNWDVWREDLFKPFQTSLATAPWIFIRGNHESCDRAGEGWFRFLDPRAYPAACQVYTDPYSIDIGNIQFIHLDSAVADDVTPYPDQIAAYQSQFEKVRAIAGPRAWLITHRPVWAIRSNLNANVVMQAASQNNLPVQMIMSGHTHTFQTYSFTPARAPQLVIGNSGDNLASVPTVPIAGQIVGGATVSQGTSLGGYGYSVITPVSGGWNIVPYDANGNQVDNCHMQPNLLTCDK